ncbi:MAG: hypothetical protein QM756_19370 [Polyangiaceae bacterium]
MPRKRLLEGLTSSTQARVSRIERDLERSRDLRRRHLVDLCENEDFPFGWVELTEQLPEQLKLVILFGLLQWREIGRSERLFDAGLVVACGALRAARAVVAAHGAPNHPIDPAPQGLWLLERMETGMDHHKDFLHDVVERFITNAKAPDRSPNEIEVCLIDLGKRMQSDGRRALPRLRLSRRSGCLRRRVAASDRQLSTQWERRAVPVKKSVPHRAIRRTLSS